MSRKPKKRSNILPALAEPERQKIDIALPTLERFVAEQKEYLSELRDLLRHPVLMTYEDLQDDYPRLLARLGVADQSFTEKLVKTSPDDLSHVVHDYERLRQSGDFEIELS